MTSYIISPLASRDLDDIFDYFAEFSVDAGERFVDDFNKKCRNLVAFPSIGRAYTEIDTSLRGIPLSGYIIFYRVNENLIEIVRVVSGHRDLASLFRGSSDID
ncbi:MULTISPECIES: type II toxin-antitoxin system RelE/ParE family toxin [Pseudanabaena]|jgi:toxin ParE1/3/4|uniref:type II toxin-antitoxin system RelE/ParE family toxin n=1 Tax=Pseudanabaena TaxID=1152 RepID=UPI00247A1402|nr:MULTISPECIES: type II toxin-antitoxin system RelE/ParE family toxin [Pseudanabaena]MEA5489822.1 type II toxin-antitoxin system RelE/ParE family toxin [Pseudanabaena sp. CCNP1317]WGS71044.1 type II toxin-antitoxin system RelE/ParE family toxin [Pseudanabaena galeata CCNP1313]